MIERSASVLSLVVQFFEPEIKPQKFGHRWGKINDYDGPDKLFPVGRRDTNLLPSSFIWSPGDPSRRLGISWWSQRPISGFASGCGLPFGWETSSLALCLIQCRDVLPTTAPCAG